MNRTQTLVGTTQTVTRWLAGLTIAATLATAAVATAQTPGNSSVTLTVYNGAHLDHRSLRAAESEATRILSAAGLSPRWVEVSATPAAYAVGSSVTPIGYTLHLVNSTTAHQPAPDELGTATVRSSSSHSATIFYDRVRQIAGGDTAPSEVLLGRVLARQVGMLLLGPQPLAHRGIMQTRWSEQQLSLAGADVFFTPDQAHRMQARLRSESAPRLNIAQR